jgi:hypothetical protein
MVCDDVMQFPGDPGAFQHRCRLGSGIPFPLEPFGPLLQGTQILLPQADIGADQVGHQQQPSVADHVPHPGVGLVERGERQQSEGNTEPDPSRPAGLVAGHAVHHPERESARPSVGAAASPTSSRTSSTRVAGTPPPATIQVVDPQIGPSVHPWVDVTG